MEAIVTGRPEEIGGKRAQLQPPDLHLPEEACVEEPCLVNGYGVQPCAVGALPVQCAAMNMTNINVQLLTIEAARTRKKEHIYQAAMLDPHTGSELDVDTIRKMVGRPHRRPWGLPAQLPLNKHTFEKGQPAFVSGGLALCGVSQKWFSPLLRGSKFGQPEVVRICKELILQAKSTTAPVGKAAGYE